MSEVQTCTWTWVVWEVRAEQLSPDPGVVRGKKEIKHAMYMDPRIVFLEHFLVFWRRSPRTR